MKYAFLPKNFGGFAFLRYFCTSLDNYARMKRVLTFILFVTLCFVGAFAQTMTDTQIVDYAKQRHAAGASQSAIITELLERGASREQLVRIKQSLETKQTKTTAMPKTDEIDRTRNNNGENTRSTNPPDTFSLEDETPTEPNTNEEEQATKIFGHDIFRSNTLSFEPNMNIAAPATYVLGPGDEVIIDVYGDSQRSDKLKVAPDGTITTTYGGPISVSGRTLQQAQSTITSRLKPFYAGSNIKVTVGQTRTIMINVMGEVKTPGTYTLSAFANVFHALYQAGGVNDIGTLRNIKVCRHGHVVTTVDVYDYILNGQLSGNIMLQDNDVILVDTYQNLIEVNGWVKRPMFYEAKSGESLATIIDYAGGFKGGAFSKQVTVERSQNTEAYVYSPSDTEFNRFIVTDGDVVTVGRSETRYNNMVRINGAVFRPGNYEITGGHPTVRSIIQQAGGLKEEALTTRAILLRMLPDRSREAITIDLAGILDGTTPDISIKNEDELTISSREREISSQTLTIQGEIYEPGTYHYAKNMTVEDLITMAGGLKESASLLNVEVSRRIVNPEGTDDTPQRAEIFNVKIQDGLRIDTQTGFHLMPFDNVYVRKSPAYSEQQSVWIGGEVLFQGRYVLENQDERLSAIIKRTGGFTSKACIRDARLKRHMNETELLRRAKLIQKAEMSASDSVSIAKLDLNETYYVGIDLNEAIKHPGGSADLVLRDGDEIIIPQLENTIKINGEVLYPNTVTYIEGKPFSYYINQAGGFTQGALKKQAYIIYNNGNVSKVRKGKVQPGCEIVIPSKKHRENTKTVATAISISTAIATIAAVLVSALK